MISQVYISTCRRHLQESFVPLRQKLNGGPLLRLSRQYNALAVDPLNSVLKCRAIDFFQNVGANLDDMVRSHCQEKPIEGRMVQST